MESAEKREAAMMDEPSPASSRGPEPLIDFAVRLPGELGLVMLAVGLVFVGLGAWLGYKGFGFGRGEAKAGESASELSASLGDPASGAYLWGMAFALSAAAPLLVTAVGLFTTPPGDTPQTRTRIRVAILTAGGIFGAVLMMAGLFFFIRWVDSLMRYFDDGNVKELRWPLYALVMLLFGAGCLFLAIQPARAEERHQPLLRRLVYGSNLILLLLLLISVLLAGNVIAARKVPNTLDTTSTGFYTLSDETVAFLQNLPQPVTAYGIFPATVAGARGRVFEDTRRLLEKCQEVSNGKLTYRAIGPTTPLSEFENLVKKYPDVELNVLGVLLTTGEDEKRHAFIRLNELTTTQGTGPERRDLFVGESRILKELQFLTEETARPVVYFTQSHGELQITEPKPEERVPPSQSARRLKEYLEKNFIDVRPLEFRLGQTEVPADATVVVVAEPTSPLDSTTAAAIRKYMTEPRGEGKKGKLIVLAGTPFPPRGPVGKLGLDEVLKEFNIEFGQEYLYGDRTDQLTPEAMEVMVYPSAVQAGNPVAKAFARMRFAAPGWRVVLPLRERPGIEVQPVLITMPGRFVWYESLPVANPEKTFAEFLESEALQRAKRLTNRAIPVGVFASEGSTSRVAAIGNSLIFSDSAAEGDPGTPQFFEIMSATIDWLRERPTLSTNLTGKTYDYFRINAGLDTTRLQWLPLAFAVFAIVGVGAGVWASRRR